MSLWQPTIARPCTPAEVAGIVRGALRALGEVGVECTHVAVQAEVGRAWKPRLHE